MAHIKRLPCRRDAWDASLALSLGIGPSWSGRGEFFFFLSPFLFSLTDGAGAGRGARTWLLHVEVLLGTPVTAGRRKRLIGAKNRLSRRRMSLITKVTIEKIALSSEPSGSTLFNSLS